MELKLLGLNAGFDSLVARSVSRMPAWLLAFVALTSVGAGQGGGPESVSSDDQFRKDLPRIDPLSPAESLSRMTLKPGYGLEIVASEPSIVDPVAIAFDEHARMYVVEMIDYSEQSEDRLGTIKLLEDKDRDGFYESSEVFATGLSWPTAIVCYDQGVFVGAAPDILYLKDTDGDGKADLNRQVFTGFGRKNVQGLVNSFRWGLDNRIYGQTSVAGGVISSSVNPDVSGVELNGKDFSFDPKHLDLRAECGGGQHGMSFDDYGNRFTCHNSDNLQAFLYEHRYELTNALVPLPPSKQSIAVDGPQANVYRSSPVEPWRILRTNLRVSGVVPGLLEGGGKPSGYFTSATGVTIYTGNQMPELYGQAFIADVGSNLVHRKKIYRDGVGWKGDRIDVESEFVSSEDTWFRPVQFANAPDGCLYILDFYREVIEHPQSLPDSIKRHLDLTNGRDKGRIYRLKDDRQPVDYENDLASLSLQQLIDTLGHPNGWHRETARRLIWEKLADHWETQESQRCLDRIESQALARLPEKAKEGRAGGLDELGLLVLAKRVPRELNAWLLHPDPNVRIAAIRLLEALANDNVGIRSAFYGLAADTDVGVRFQLALSLSQLPIFNKGTDGRQVAVRTLLERMTTDVAYRSSVANLLEPFAVGFMLERMREIDSERGEASGAGEGYVSGAGEGVVSGVMAASRDQADELLGYCFARVASSGELVEFDRMWKKVSSISDSDINMIRDKGNGDWKRLILKGFLNGLAAKRDLDHGDLEGLVALQISIAELIDRSVLCLADPRAPLKERMDAIGALRWASEEVAVNNYLSLLHPSVPVDLQEKALGALGAYQTPSIANSILDRIRGFSPALRVRSIDLLMGRPGWLGELLNRLEREEVAWDDFSASQRMVLKNHADPTVRDRVARFFQSVTSNRAALVEQYQKALALKGDVDAGKQHFVKLCAACHRVENVGYELGPNLAAYRYRGPDAILQNILDPNREVNPMYLSYSVRTHDDRTVSGMMESESSEVINLTRGADYREAIKRSEIGEMRSSRLSVMPEGFENQLDVQSMADLLAYLMQVR